MFQRLCVINPSPYGALMNLGEGEFLVSASPEMFVRSDGRRVETCPISGTIARGTDAIGDAEQIRQLLNSEKDEFELNMCTDVDRNDKARVCVPGTIKVLARRQIETYSKLFHTVDHVEGMLRPGFDALDAFLTHAWAVTVTGAPKLWAMQFVEDHERSPRRWYAGAIGAVNFDGSINTGLTIRTIRMKEGLAEVRVGATCLFDSDPAAEDRECQVKAAALFQALRGDPPKPLSAFAPDATGSGKRVLLIDHDDSFVHMLADYFRQVGADVTVVRHVHALDMLRQKRWDLLVLSPGPGRPEDFGIKKTIDAALDNKLPVLRRLPRRPGDRRVFRRRTRAAHASRPRPALAGAGPRREVDAQSAERDRYRPLSLALCRARQHARSSRCHGQHRGRRGHGAGAQDPAGRRRAIPSGIADVAQRRGGITNCRECVPAGSAR
ncbi:anthranilate synthase [Bradyrhizobium sp. LM6.11]